MTSYHQITKGKQCGNSAGYEHRRRLLGKDPRITQVIKEKINGITSS